MQTKWMFAAPQRRMSRIEWLRVVDLPSEITYEMVWVMCCRIWPDTTLEECQ